MRPGAQMQASSGEQRPTSHCYHLTSCTRRRALGHCHQHLLACERNTGRLECGLPALKEGPPAVCQAQVWYQAARYTQASQHCGAGWHSTITDLWKSWLHGMLGLSEELARMALRTRRVGGHRGHTGRF